VKSTLLGVCATLVRPTSGEVRYGRGTADQLGDGLRARIGLLGHDLFLYGDMTARENLEFFGQLYGVPELAARVQESLDLAGLRDRAHDRVSGFSRGLRQRLAFERAALHAPRLALLDEPFTGLDDASTTRLADRLRAIRDAGAIVLMATHDFETAESVVDRAVCLREGRMLEIGQGAGSLRERYRETLRAAAAEARS
jgi:heme exporter protein A